MPDEIKFPLTFERCPNCGGTRRLAQSILEQEKEKGKILGEEVKAAIFTPPPTIITDPRAISLSSPAIVTHYDVCIEKVGDGLCGTLYCVRADLGRATVGQAPKGFPSGFPPGDPRLS